MTASASLRSNLFAGKCVSCRRDVPAGKGVAVRLARRRRVSWGVRCAECVAAQKGEGMPVGTEEGLDLHTPEYERRIAETLADRRPSRKGVLERAERREEMVRAIVTGSGLPVDPIRRGLVAENICDWADDLIRELDRREAAELQEAR